MDSRTKLSLCSALLLVTTVLHGCAGISGSSFVLFGYGYGYGYGYVCLSVCLSVCLYVCIFMCVYMYVLT